MPANERKAVQLCGRRDSYQSPRDGGLALIRSSGVSGGLTLQGFPSGPMTISGGSGDECVSTDIVRVQRGELALRDEPPR